MAVIGMMNLALARGLWLLLQFLLLGDVRQVSVCILYVTCIGLHIYMQHVVKKAYLQVNSSQFAFFS